MADLKSSNFRHLYHLTVKALLKDGRKVAPRGQPTRELPAMTLRLDDLRRGEAALPVNMNRGCSPALAAVEALQIIGGEQHPNLMRRVVPNVGRFMDGGAFHGAYGERLRGQLEVAVQRLSDDPDTRQAVVTIWDPLRDLHVQDLHDYPCTVYLQFLIRNGRVELHTHMRSNDVWWGLAHDAFVFTQLQWSIAHALETEPGTYFHHAASMHIYERDIEHAKLLDINIRRRPPTVRGIPVPLEEATMPGSAARLRTIGRAARRLLVGKEDTNLPSLNWYRDTLKEYVP